MRNLVLAALLIAMNAAGCGEGEPALRMPGDSTSKWSVAMSKWAYGEPLSVGSMSLCVTLPGTATITRVALHEPTGDIRVEAFGVRPNPFVLGLDAVGLQAEPLAEIGDGFDLGGVQQVSEVCPTEAQRADPDYHSTLSEFAVQVSWGSGDVSGGPGLDVTYEVDGVERTAVIPFGIWLCAATCPDDLGSS